MKSLPLLSTLIIDPAYTLIIGSAFGLRALGSARARPLVLGFVLCLLAGIGLPVYAYAKEPAWMWMYFVNPAGVPTWMVAYAFLVLYVPPFFVGFYVTAHLKERSRLRAFAFFVFTLLFQGALIYFLWDRYSAIGSHEQWLAKQTVPLWESSLAKVLNIAFPACAVVGLVMWWLAKPKRAVSCPNLP